MESGSPNSSSWSLHRKDFLIRRCRLRLSFFLKLIDRTRRILLDPFQRRRPLPFIRDELRRRVDPDLI